MDIRHTLQLVLAAEEIAATCQHASVDMGSREDLIAEHVWRTKAAELINRGASVKRCDVDEIARFALVRHYP